MHRLLPALVMSGALVAGTAVVAQSPTQAQQPPQTQAVQPPAGDPKVASPADADFVKNAWLGGKAEVELAEEGRAHAENDAVEDFAEELERVHRDANAQLHMIADRLDVELPEDLTAEHKATELRLHKLNGAEFDRAFLDQMVKNHEAAIVLFTKGSQGSNITVRTFAESKLAAIRDHLKRAQTLRASIGQ
jgi:putative membrane protein